MNRYLIPLAFSLLLLAVHIVYAQKKDRPNILFVIADDWGYPHAGAYGDPIVKTPDFDRIANNGVLFTNAYCAAPSCTPSRAAMLTGLYPHRLQQGVNLWGFLPSGFPTYPQLLKEAGYAVGSERKGWGPGNYQAGGYQHNPAGPQVHYREFFKDLPADQPFCFWYGSSDPHRPYVEGAGASAGLAANSVKVPPFLPDVPVIRNDILDYYYEVQRFDNDLGKVLALLDSLGRLENTLIVVTSDNGIPFPRAKANVYDGGARLPLAVCWAGRIRGGRVFDGFVSLVDIAATFLDVAGIAPPAIMDGKSLLPVLTGGAASHRSEVFIERERHARARAGNTGYPVRAVRTKEFLYVRNLKPDRWPAGDSGAEFSEGVYGDIDRGPSKAFLVKQQPEPFATLALHKRPAEELYDLRSDPHQLKNVAANKKYAAALAALRAKVDSWMLETKDPRRNGGGAEIEQYPYFGRKK